MLPSSYEGILVGSAACTSRTIIISLDFPLFFPKNDITRNLSASVSLVKAPGGGWEASALR